MRRRHRRKLRMDLDPGCYFSSLWSVQKFNMNLLLLAEAAIVLRHFYPSSPSHVISARAEEVTLVGSFEDIRGDTGHSIDWPRGDDGCANEVYWQQGRRHLLENHKFNRRVNANLCAGVEGDLGRDGSGAIDTPRVLC